MIEENVKGNVKVKNHKTYPLKEHMIEVYTVYPCVFYDCGKRANDSLS
jgi:hypothetical protein